MIFQGTPTRHRSPLFQPIRVGALSLPNRIVMAPMTRTRASNEGVPSDLNATYYAQRSTAGLIITECAQVSRQGHGILRCPGIHTAEQVEGWRRVTSAVHAAGGRIFLQLWHCGRVSHPQILSGESPVAPSPIAAEGKFFLPEGRVDFPVPRELALSEIPQIVDDFGAAAANAKLAGFDGVELHGAFGYLPDQFLQDNSNRRTDRYGGSVVNRARFALEVIESLRGVWGAERVGVKLSPSNRFYGMRDSNAKETFGYLIGELDRLGLAYVHLMEPSPFDLKTGTVQIEAVASTFRPRFSGTLISNGGYDFDKAQRALEDRIADVISFGTHFVANPDLPYRLLTDTPLAVSDHATHYGEGPGGYVDYPFAGT